MKCQTTAQRLIEAMAEANIKSSELALRSGVNKASISQYVNGKNEPHNINAYKMAKVLNVRPEWLMGLDDKKRDVPAYVNGTIELIDLFSRVTPEQRQAVLSLLRSFVN